MNTLIERKYLKNIYRIIYVNQGKKNREKKIWKATFEILY